MFEVEYINYIVVLLIITGIYILSIEVKAYKNVKMKKEKKFAKFLGLMNITVGILLFASNWVYQNWLW